MIKAILFDLDGTLLPMDIDEFLGGYFRELTGFAAKNCPEIAPSLIKDMMEGCNRAILSDDPKTTVADIFWEYFCSANGQDREYLDELFTRYYTEHFDELRLRPNERMVEVVEACKAKGLRMAVATNPIFPKEPIYKRVGWAGLNTDDFEIITSYEIMHFAKPNPSYYKEIAAMLGLECSQCAMVGNHGREDMIAGTVGMKTFLLLGHELDADGYTGESGNLDALIEWISRL